MNGQIEGLEIGGEAVSLWNYKKAEAIKVCQIPHQKANFYEMLQRIIICSYIH